MMWVTDQIYIDELIILIPLLVFLTQGEITETGTMRALLYKHWASVPKWYRYQPLDDIKEYFGVKIGELQCLKII